MQIIIGLTILIVAVTLAVNIIVWIVKGICSVLPYIFGIAIMGLVGYGIYYVIKMSSETFISKIINITLQTLYFGLTLAVLFIAGVILSEVLKRMRMRWLMIPFLIGLLTVILTLKPNGYIIPNTTAFAIALGASMALYVWSFVQFFRIGRNIGFSDALDSNIVIFYAGMVTSLGSLCLFILDFPSNYFTNIYVYVIAYLGLLTSLFGLNSQVHIYKKVIKFAQKSGYFSISDLLENPLLQKKERKAYAQQIVLKLKKRKYIVEVNMKSPVYLRMPIYIFISKELINHSSRDVAGYIENEFKLTIPEGIIDLIASDIAANKKIVKLAPGDKGSDESVPKTEEKEALEKPTLQNKFVLEQKLEQTVTAAIEPKHIEEMGNIEVNAIVHDVKSIEFMLMRYDINLNPITLATEKYKEAYYGILKYFLKDFLECSSALNAVLNDYQTALKIDDGTKNRNEMTNISTNATLLFKNEFYRVSFFRYRIKNYRYLLLAEALYFTSLLTGKLDISLMDKQCLELKVKPKDKEFLSRYLSLVTANDHIKAEELLLACKNKYLTDTMWSLHKNILLAQLYDKLPKHNVAVCATMSSGKSTFVNALLGKDYIPSKNEACTAKITSIADNDHLDDIIGIKEDFCGEHMSFTKITSSKLEEWNRDNTISRIRLESNLDGIRSKHGIVVVNDTPGTNYSGDESHYDITMRFLQGNQIDTLIYLINAEHSSTTDNQILLKQIKAEVIDKQNTSILFLVNKIDSFDTEKDDDIVSCLSEVKKELLEYGYTNPKIIPTSANAARLFKMVLKNQELTKKEVVSFKNFFDLFYCEGLDLLKYTDEAFDTTALSDSDAEFEIGGLKVKRSEVKTALFRTGIPLVEKILDEKINL